VVPIDGSPPRRLAGYTEDAALQSAAVSPSGQRVAAAFGFGQGEKSLRVWDLQSGSVKRVELPPGKATGPYERGIQSLGFSGEAILYSAGDGGLRRWNLETGTQELVVASPPGFSANAHFSRDARYVLLTEFTLGRDGGELRPIRVYDTHAATFTTLPVGLDEPGQARFATALDPSGRVAAVGGDDGMVRIWRLGDSKVHILDGHKGALAAVAISPDLRWVATTGEDNTLRLWPMPDLSRPPLHTLPLDQLLAKLRSLTNLRAVRDPSSSTGWKIEIGPFPGWKDVPTW
jgi:WD40 repeat protein